MRSRPWFWGLMLLTAVLVLLIGTLLLRAADTTGLSMIQSDAASYRAIGSGVRLGLIGMLAVFWPRLISMALRRGYLEPAAARQLCSGRWRLVGWLAALELLIGINAPNVISQALSAVTP